MSYNTSLLEGHYLRKEITRAVGININNI